MLSSLLAVDGVRQPGVDAWLFRGLAWVMQSDEDERKAIGAKLAAARALAGYSLRGLSKALLTRGYTDPPSHAAIGHWETGRSAPDALWLRRLSRMYKVSADALLGLIQDGELDTQMPKTVTAKTAQNVHAFPDTTSGADEWARDQVAQGQSAAAKKKPSKPTSRASKAKK